MYKVQKTKFDGLFIINLDYKLDDRGYFVKNFKSDFFINNKFKFKIKEINISYNKLRGTLRGIYIIKKLHFLKLRLFIAYQVKYMMWQ